MNQDHADSASAANPFASLMNPASCIEAHDRLARLPQKQYRHMDKPNLPKGPEVAGSNEDDHMGFVAL